MSAAQGDGVQCCPLRLTRNIRPGAEPLDIDAYEKKGGYRALRKALSLSPRGIQKLVMDSNLRGRGGAGFATGKKWSFVPMGDKARRPKYIAVNADEMEPGTFKDRLLLEGDPNAVVESAIISAYAIEAEAAYIFLRWDFLLKEHFDVRMDFDSVQKAGWRLSVILSPYKR